MAWHMSTTVLTSGVLCLFLSYIVLRRKKKAQHLFPPGPPPKPIIGNAFDLPLRKPWLKFSEWAKTFDSDIIYLHVLDKHIFILNKLEDMVQILDRRSRSYSSRPPNEIAKILGIETFTPFLPYGEVFKKQRKFFEEYLKKDAVQSYRRVLEDKVHLLLDGFLKDPAGFEKHCSMLAASINLSTTFGHDNIPGKKQDLFVEMGSYAIAASSELALPGKTLIAVFPFLKYIPPWFPGASTQKFAAEVREAFMLYRTGSLAYVKRTMASGTAKDSILKRLLESSGSTDGPSSDPVLMDAASTLYLAAVETTSIVLLVFVLAMTLHPTIQKTAQEEIDRVIGSDRLPTFEDRRSMPFVEAIHREALRWQPVTPIAFPHSCDEDDKYKGYHIPKGAIVIPNVWAVTRNEAVYSDPETFKPERFIKDDGTLTDDKVSCMFGFGRRVCPGKYMADMAVWLTIASVLAMFNITKVKDENGNEIKVTVDPDAFTDAVTPRPKPFRCSIVTRSRLAKTVVENRAEAILQTLSGS